MKILFLFTSLLFVNILFAHPSPNTLMLLDIKANGVATELHLPVIELSMALHPAAPKTAAELLGSFKDSLRLYLISHIKPMSMDGQKWTVNVGEMNLENVANPQERNSLQDIIVKMWLQPPPGSDSRRFILQYDAVMHQVVTHSAVVSIRQDWENGIVAAHPSEVGVISVDPRSSQIFPLTVSLENKGWWGGFNSMVGLGRKHIAAGTDHLLFLLVLLLVAPLQVNENRWDATKNIRYALLRITKIITAFTIGHSLTLLAGAIGWLRLPSQPIEILIAFSILISAIHAMRPLFAGREVYVAAGFGLIHGMAFANTLEGLNLETGQLIISILGFNLGIELMQLLVILLTVPWLILLSRTTFYHNIRWVGAIFAAVAAIAWMLERSFG
jgi:hypothetical protein